MSYYPEADRDVRDKVKVVLDLSNYATKKELEQAAGVDIIALKAEVDKLDSKNLVNVVTGLNDLKTKANELDVDKL